MKPGPRPDPSKVHYLRGNASKKPESKLLDDFLPDVELPNCPKFLSKDARAEYKRLGEELERYGLISQLDRGVLIGMCIEWARYIWAEEKITELNAKDVHGERGLVDQTPNGFKQQSVYLQISRKSMEIYLRHAAEFGLTPSARTRVTPSPPQLELPGMPEAPDSGRPTLRSFA